MKKLFSLLFLTLFSLSLTGCGTSIGFYSDADKYLIGNQTYSESISSLDIDWLSGKLTLVEDETIQGVKIEEETDLTNEKELVHSYLKDGELKIKFFASGHRKMGFTSFKKDLTVAYHPGIAIIEIDITSGYLNAESITADKINIELTSGSSKIGTIISKDIGIDFTSGNMTIENVATDNFDAEMTSGDMTVTHINANTFDADMTSGDIKVGFDDISEASFDITSGKIDMTLPSSGGKVKVDKTSGRVNAIRQCSVDNNLYKFDDGIANIKVNMTSGTLTIR